MVLSKDLRGTCFYLSITHNRDSKLSSAFSCQDGVIRKEKVKKTITEPSTGIRQEATTSQEIHNQTTASIRQEATTSQEIHKKTASICQEEAALHEMRKKTIASICQKAAASHGMGN
jgi:hypothetical protein